MSEDTRAEDARDREASDYFYDKWVREYEIYVLGPFGQAVRVR